MLILTRKTGESIIIDSEIKIIVADVQGNQIRIGIEAPEKVKINREEIHNKIQADKDVA